MSQARAESQLDWVYHSTYLSSAGISINNSEDYFLSWRKGDFVCISPSSSEGALDITYRSIKPGISLLKSLESSFPEDASRLHVLVSERGCIEGNFDKSDCSHMKYLVHKTYPNNVPSNASLIDSSKLPKLDSVSA